MRTRFRSLIPVASITASALVLAWSVAAASERPPPAKSAAKAVDSDPADFRALQQVCARCHTLGMFTDMIKSQPDWGDTIQSMVDRGATGSDEQFARVYNYLAQSQSAVNVNSAPSEEIGPVLNVSDAIAAAIVARRATRKFTGLADLKTIPGVDPGTLDARKNRISF